MTLRVAISNQKGGTGKTTTAINVAGALSQRGNSVLLVDLDPQGHSTEALGFAEEYEVDAPSIFDALTDINRKDLINELRHTHQEFDLVPSHIDMFKAESALTTERRREERLNLLLDEVNQEYDLILIDCPPNLGVLTDNAILAAKNVLIPAQTRTSSIRALEILFDQIKALEETYNITVKRFGVVANEFRNDNEAREMLEWFQNVFTEDKVYKIPTRVALQRAWNNDVSIYLHDEDVPEVEREYDRIAADLEEVTA